MKGVKIRLDNCVIRSFSILDSPFQGFEILYSITIELHSKLGSAALTGLEIKDLRGSCFLK